MRLRRAGRTPSGRFLQLGAGLAEDFPKGFVFDPEDRTGGRWPPMEHLRFLGLVTGIDPPRDAVQKSHRIISKEMPLGYEKIQQNDRGESLRSSLDNSKEAPRIHGTDGRSSNGSIRINWATISGWIFYDVFPIGFQYGRGRSSS